MAGLVLGDLDELAEPELAVAVGGFAAHARPLVEVAQEDAQERGLQLVEPRVVPDSSKVFFALEPWKRSSRMRSPSSSSRAATRPPSPSANRFFVG